MPRFTSAIWAPTRAVRHERSLARKRAIHRSRRSGRHSIDSIREHSASAKRAGDRYRCSDWKRFPTPILCSLRESNDITPRINLNTGRPAGPGDTLAPEGEMQEDRRPSPETINPHPRNMPRSDIYAAGDAGGGTAIGGLAGTNIGRGDPTISDLHDATGSGNFDTDDDRLAPDTPLGGPAGGAVGGTPARKRAK